MNETIKDERTGNENEMTGKMIETDAVESKDGAQALPDVLNEVEVVSGKIIGFGQDFLGRPRIRVYIRGASDDSKAPLYLNFTIDKDADAPQDLRRLDVVDIHGYVISYVSNSNWERDKHDGRPEPVTQYLVATKITHSVSRMTSLFGLNGRIYYKRANEEARFIGVIENVYKNDVTKWTTLTVGIKERGKRPCSVRVQYSSHMKVSDNVYEVGDKIAVIASFYLKEKRRHDSPQGDSSDGANDGNENGSRRRPNSSRRRANNPRQWNSRNNDDWDNYYENMIPEEIVVIRKGEKKAAEEEESNLFEGIG